MQNFPLLGGFDRRERERHSVRLKAGFDRERIVHEVLEIDQHSFNLLVSASETAASVGIARGDLKDFNKDQEESLRQQYSWLSNDSVQSLRTFASWMAWHQGL